MSLKLRSIKLVTEIQCIYLLLAVASPLSTHRTTSYSPAARERERRRVWGRPAAHTTEPQRLARQTVAELGRGVQYMQNMQ